MYWTKSSITEKSDLHSSFLFSMSFEAVEPFYYSYRNLMVIEGSLNSRKSLSLKFIMDHFVMDHIPALQLLVDNWNYQNFDSSLIGNFLNFKRDCCPFKFKQDL